MADIFSIWALPEREAFNNLRDLIGWISNRLDSPIFPPHITLAGEIEHDLVSLFAGIAKLSSGIDPFDVTMKRQIQTSDEYYKRIFLSLEENEHLTKLRTIIMSTLGQEAQDPFNASFSPHVSLAYTDFPEPERAFLTKIQDQLKKSSFLVKEISITNSSSLTPIADWAILGSFTLKKGE